MKIKLFYIPALLLLLTACGKDWLEIEPTAGYTSDEYSPDDELTAENAQAVLDGAYVPYGYLNPWGTSIWVSLNCLTDEVNVGGGAAGDRPEFESLNFFTVNASSNSALYLWQKLYQGVNAVNLLMRDAAEVNNPPSLDRILAEARVLRAFYYFDLIRLYGNVPYVLGEDFQLVFESTDWHVILDEQIQTVNDNASKLTDKNADGKFNQAAAYTLLGKMNMWKGDYEAAAVALAKVVANPKFGLLDNYDDVFSYLDQLNKEVIYTITWESMGYSWDSWVKTSNVDLKLCGIRSIAWTGPAEIRLEDGWGFLKPRQGIVDAYIAENDAVRLNANIWIGDPARDNDLFTFKLYDNATWTDTYGYDGFFRRKYSFWFDIPSVGEGAGMNEIVYRYSDVLLLMAECAVNGASTPQSADFYVNAVRSRVDLPAKSGVTMADVKLERRLELAFEFDRFFDLVRWGDAATTLTPYGYRAETNGLLPIPLSQIISSGKGLTQNPGY